MSLPTCRPSGLEPSRPIKSARLLLGLVALATIAASAAGCMSYRHLSLDSTSPGNSSAVAGGDASPDVAARWPATMPDQPAGQTDIVRQVRDYTTRLEQARREQDVHGPSASRPIRPGELGRAPDVASGKPGPSGGPGRTVNPVEADAARAGTTGTRLADLDGGPPVVVMSGPLIGAVPPEPAESNAVGRAASPSPERAADPARSADPHTAINASLADAATLAKASPGRTLAEAVVAAERQAAGQPADFRTQFQLRVLYIAAGKTRQAQAPWTAGSAKEQKMLAAWVDAAVALGDGHQPAGKWQSPAADPDDTALAAVERLRDQLAEHAALKVRTIKFASRVDGFGVVTPFETDSYRPGQWTIVYAELENLTSRLDADGTYHTELALRVEVLSAEGKSLLCQEDKQVVDRSLNQRRDFFVARRVRLPADMTAGQYVLRLSVEDKNGAKVGESMLRFQAK